METMTRDFNRKRITLIDATELDDEQFNALITDLDPRLSLIPILFGLTIFLVLATFI